jgi:DNA-binding transcriptional ArsR family regulator
MEFEHQFTKIATLIGERARATMLWNLLDGRAYTAGELAIVSNTSPQSASSHLVKLTEAGILKVEKQGKHRYYRFSNNEVAYAVEAIANLIPEKRSFSERKPCVNGDIQYCRSCYDHLAGKVAVEITQALLKQAFLVQTGECFLLTPSGENWFSRVGVNVEEIKKSSRHFARPCLDWTERKHHLAGSLGAALLRQMQKHDWLRPKANSRIMVLTGKGESDLMDMGLLFRMNGH